MPIREATPRHRVLIVDDEEQALHLAENYAYDAILLDLLMPGIGGYGVLSEIRHSSPNAATPVIVVSQVTEKEAIDRCMAAGASAYHTKPVRRPELVETVKEQLAARQR